MNKRRVLASIEQRDSFLLVRVYADRGEVFELVDWGSAPAEEARADYVEGLRSGDFSALPVLGPSEIPR